MVFNHTGTDSPFQILAPEIFYIKKENNDFLDVTGCCNTFNSNHPIVTEYIIECLRYWVSEMHIDGFRFDEVGTFVRDVKGEIIEENLSNILNYIKHDPTFYGIKLIAEPWDCGDNYVNGHKSYHNWLYWNDHFEHTVYNYNLDKKIC